MKEIILRDLGALKSVIIARKKLLIQKIKDHVWWSFIWRWNSPGHWEMTHSVLVLYRHCKICQNVTYSPWITGRRVARRQTRRNSSPCSRRCATRGLASPPLGFCLTVISLIFAAIWKLVWCLFRRNLLKCFGRFRVQRQP